jgi:Ca-activated chloride channel homolog
MSAPLRLNVALERPGLAAGREPETPAIAQVTVQATAPAEGRPVIDVSFLLDASASMYRFQLDPQQRSAWRQRAVERGEVQRQEVDGRTGMVWTGQTLRELQQVVSTPMLSSLRGIWRTLEALSPTDRTAVIGFGDRCASLYQDQGVSAAELRLTDARAALARLGGGVDESGLGRGTCLSGALGQALARFSSGTGQTVRRVVLISDGVIEDAEACEALLHRATDEGIVISVIGVGDEFDEEFLMWVSDLTRGSYVYAASAPEVEQAVAAEMRSLAQVTARRVWLRLRPLNDTILRDIHAVTPSLSAPQVLQVDDDGWRVPIGDVSGAHELAFLVTLAPAERPEGQTPLIEVTVEGQLPNSTEVTNAQAQVDVFYTEDERLLQATDEAVRDAVHRLEIYQEERLAAAATRRGDFDSATRHLRAATRMLRGIGADQLAEEMDQAADEAAAGTRDLSRTKRVKAGTRKLGSR